MNDPLYGRPSRGLFQPNPPGLRAYAAQEADPNPAAQHRVCAYCQKPITKRAARHGGLVLWRSGISGADSAYCPKAPKFVRYHVPAERVSAQADAEPLGAPCAGACVYCGQAAIRRVHSAIVGGYGPLAMPLAMTIHQATGSARCAGRATTARLADLRCRWCRERIIDSGPAGEVWQTAEDKGWRVTCPAHPLPGPDPDAGGTVYGGHEPLPAAYTDAETASRQLTDRAARLTRSVPAELLEKPPPVRYFCGPDGISRIGLLGVSLTVEAAAGLIGHLAAAVERSLAVVDTEAQLRHEPEPADLSGRRFCSRCGLRIYQNVVGLDPGHDPDEWAHEEMPPVAGSYRRWVYACPGRAQQPQEAG